MTKPALLTVGGYPLATDRYYDPDTHLWIKTESPESVRCGFDPLGSETSGDVVAVAFEPVGATVERGAAFGSLEAAKFVGPLIAPLSGTIRAHNDAVLERPGLVNSDPLAHWLIELEPARPGDELALLLHDPEAVRAWFEAEVERFRHQGMVAQ